VKGCGWDFIMRQHRFLAQSRSSIHHDQKGC
jgi:hypothetical protein